MVGRGLVSRGLKMGILLVGRGLSYGYETTESWLSKDNNWLLKDLSMGVRRLKMIDYSVKNCDYITEPKEMTFLTLPNR